MSGFLVDFTALSQAADGIQETMDRMATKKVSDLDLGSDRVGDHTLADVLGQFARRWNIGVTNLESDVDSVLSGLQSAVSAYRQTDEATQAGFSGVISRASGSDPAAS